jgi:hypothetical protein
LYVDLTYVDKRLPKAEAKPQGFGNSIGFSSCDYILTLSVDLTYVDKKRDAEAEAKPQYFGKNTEF